LVNGRAGPAGVFSAELEFGEAVKNTTNPYTLDSFTVAQGCYYRVSYRMTTTNAISGGILRAR